MLIPLLLLDDPPVYRLNTSLISSLFYLVNLVLLQDFLQRRAAQLNSQFVNTLVAGTSPLHHFPSCPHTLVCLFCVLTALQDQGDAAPHAKASLNNAGPSDMVAPAAQVSEESLPFLHKQETCTVRTLNNISQTAYTARCGVPSARTTALTLNAKVKNTTEATTR